MKKILATALVLAAGSAANAQLGGLAWTFNANGGSGSFTDDGSTLNLTGDDSGLLGTSTLYSHTSAGGPISFDWSYFSSDSGCFDSGGYLVNGSLVQLACNTGTATSGHVDLNLNPGDLFEFVVYSADGIFGAGTLTVTNWGGGSGECYADCEKDGDLDVFDFLCFQGLYANGCD